MTENNNLEIDSNPKKNKNPLTYYFMESGNIYGDVGFIGISKQEPATDDLDKAPIKKNKKLTKLQKEYLGEISQEYVEPKGEKIFDALVNNNYSTEVAINQIENLTKIINEVKSAPEGTKFYDMTFIDSSGSRYHGESPWRREEVSKEEFISKVTDVISQSLGKNVKNQSISDSEQKFIDEAAEKERNNDKLAFKKLTALAIADGSLSPEDLKNLTKADLILTETKGDVSTWSKLQQENYAIIERNLREANAPESLKK